MLTHNLLGLVALDFLSTFVPTNDVPLRAEHEDRIILYSINEYLESFFTLPQDLVRSLQLRRAFDDTLLQCRVESAYFLLGALALRDVADVALNDFFVAGLIHVADKLHGNMAVICRFQWQVFIADIPVLL